MAVLRVIEVLLVAVIISCTCEPTNSYNNNGNIATHFGELLKPPPLPLLPIAPVPFHGGTGISQRQNFGPAFQYLPALQQSQQQSPNSINPLNDFKFPAPFYKQYNFNFVPPPQPFLTTPSPSLFHKVSNWLFPSQEVTEDLKPIGNPKKECNPCNLVPWIPVIRYDLAAKNIRNQNINPTYGPPSPTASANVFNAVQNIPQPFVNQNFEYNSAQYSTSSPHADFVSNNGYQVYSHVASTYGPPSPTHTVDFSQASPLSSPYSISSTSFNSSPYEVYSTTIEPVTFKGMPTSSYDLSSSIYRSPSPTYGTPSPSFESNNPTTTIPPIFLSSRPDFVNQHLPNGNDVEIFKDIIPSDQLELPKVTRPTGFRNSYGEPIANPNVLDIPYSVTAIGAESSRIKSKVLPNKGFVSNVENRTLALANPAPFSLNRGRNIHTLQPVALPNLSVSPLPPIFNARPFRPTPQKPLPYYIQELNKKRQESDNVNISPSIPVAEFTHSIEYPTTFIESPVIDIDKLKLSNQSKAYRNIQNSYVIDEFRDISPEASDHHISAAKSNQEFSFESTGPEYNNDLSDPNIHSDLILNTNIPSNHKPAFADLRGVKDEDVDKYRTESNLQHIDSPLLYLKPNAPHKSYKNFGFTASTPRIENEYEIYDDIPTTQTPLQSTMSTIWGQSQIYFNEYTSLPTAQSSNNKPKIVQIIVPYTTDQKTIDDENSFALFQQESQARKVQTGTENNFVTIDSDYNALRTTTEDSVSTVTDQFSLDRLNTPAILNDLYDVKEPPFDIIKLQHTIDDWTEQEYSNGFKESQKERSNKKYAKQIPDEYFTTINPITNEGAQNVKYNFDLYDHEFSSSMQHTVIDNKPKVINKAGKGYNNNIIEKTKTKYVSGKNEENDETENFYIYTAASTFRSKTTTPAPWGLIQTSISPLTNEKVYVVTSKPWQDKQNRSSEYDYEIDKFESRKTAEVDDKSALDNLAHKPPEIFNSSLYGFNERLQSIALESPYAISKGWHRRINNLENPPSSEYTSAEDESSLVDSTSTEKATTLSESG